MLYILRISFFLLHIALPIAFAPEIVEIFANYLIQAITPAIGNIGGASLQKSIAVMQVSISLPHEMLYFLYSVATIAFLVPAGRLWLWYSKAQYSCYYCGGFLAFPHHGKCKCLNCGKRQRK
ncbi:MAG TPA: hypothetical protein ACQGQH_02570 [Xylella sp.]